MTGPKIADLTVNEFKELVRESVVQSITGLLGDPDQGPGGQAWRRGNRPRRSRPDT